MIGRYYGTIRISDGVNSLYVNSAGKIFVKGKRGDRFVIETNGALITGHKIVKSGKVIQHERLGKFFKGYEDNRLRLFLQYHPKSQRALHDINERYDQKMFGFPGKCRTMYSRGRLVWQEFRYLNRKLAYHFNLTDKMVKLKRPYGELACVIECTGKGFSRNPDRDNGRLDGRAYFGSIAGCQNRDYEGRFENRNLDFSRDGNLRFTSFDTKGRLYSQGEFRNRQRVGEWVIAGRHVYFIRGVEVAKKLWDTPPEKLKFKTILKLKNAQLRAALIARAGYERLVKEFKHKVIHMDKKRGNTLMEFPIRATDPNGMKSWLRILQVLCPSTKTKYFLSVPDYVWDGGRKTKLDTCERARQWTFHRDDPRDKINFHIET